MRGRVEGVLHSQVFFNICAAFRDVERLPHVTDPSLCSSTSFATLPNVCLNSLSNNPSAASVWMSEMKGGVEVKVFLNAIRDERCGLPEDLHVTRMCGGLVAVSNREVIKVADTRMDYCPLSSSVYDCMKGFETCSLESKRQMIAAGVGSKINRFGHFTTRRELQRCDVVIHFGASEMMMYALERKGVDAAVTVCDGAGTVITQEPNLVQGIGARMNGLFHTSPIREVIDAIEEDGGHVLSPKTALTRRGIMSTNLS